MANKLQSEHSKRTRRCRFSPNLDWLKKSVDPKFGLDPEDIEYLHDHGVLHTSPHEADGGIYALILERIQDVTNVVERDGELSPEWQSLSYAICHIVDHHDTRLRDTLSASEKRRISILKKSMPSAELANTFNIHPVVSRQELSRLAVNARAFSEHDSSRKKHHHHRTQTNQCWEEILTAAAKYMRCSIVADEVLTKRSQPGNSWFAIPRTIQDIILQLDVCDNHSVNGLMWVWPTEGPLIYPHLTPKGRAVFWMLFEDNIWSSRRELDRVISDSYSLSPAEGYEFVLWKYIGRFFSHHYFLPDHEIWSYSKILRPLGLNPINPVIAYREHLPWKYNYRIRPRLIRLGIDPCALSEVEEKYVRYLTSDYEYKHNLLQSNLLFVVARIIKEENPDLVAELRKRIRWLFKQALIKKNPGILREQACKQLKNALLSDPLLYAVCYSMVYLPEYVVGGYQNTPKKRGPKTSDKRLAASAVLVDLVEVIRDSKSAYPFDTAAKVLNSLADYDIYSRFRSQSTGSKSSGGAIVKKEYYLARSRR